MRSSALGWRKRQTAEMKTGMGGEIWDVGGINNIIQDFRWERGKEGRDWEPQTPGSQYEGRRSSHILRTKGTSPQETTFVKEVRKKS